MTDKPVRWTARGVLALSWLAITLALALPSVTRNQTLFAFAAFRVCTMLGLACLFYEFTLVVRKRSSGGAMMSDSLLVLSMLSGGPAVKQDHILVQVGPYAISRHPIYTGFLTAVLGTSTAAGRYRAILGFLLVLLSMLVKTRQEEELMAESFPEDYARYRTRVRALVPWIF